MEPNNSFPSTPAPFAPADLPVSNTPPIIPPIPPRDVQNNFSGRNQNSAGDSSGSKLAGPVELLSSAWNLFKNNWKILVPIAIIPSLVIYIFNSFALTGVPALYVLAVLGVIVGVILAITMQGALINAVKRLSTENGVRLSVGQQYRFGLSYFWPIIFLLILQMLIGVGSSVLLLVPGIIVMVFLSLYAFALIVDNKRGFSAFTESFSLIKGRWWGVLGRILFLCLIMIVLPFLIGIVTSILSAFVNLIHVQFIMVLVILVLNLIFTAIIGPLAVAYIYKMYSSLKETRAMNVSTAGFKKWLVAFLVIGIITVLVMPLGLFFIVSNSLQEARINAMNAYNASQNAQMNSSNYANNQNPIQNPTLNTKTTK